MVVDIDGVPRGREYQCPRCGCWRVLRSRPRPSTVCASCRGAAAARAMPKPPHYKWLPERRGPIWKAFVTWWKTSPEQADKRRSTAWRGFHAGYLEGQKP